MTIKVGDTVWAKPEDWSGPSVVYSVNSHGIICVDHPTMGAGGFDISEIRTTEPDELDILTDKLSNRLKWGEKVPKSLLQSIVKFAENRS